ncbi:MULTISPECIES: septal ring lytic transglycosylase RlpA family protein [Nocardiopsis]|uniref:Probable endolytic peptidoglycan transglycosylase RlpA n=1 Tax=Nocardiopsis alba TaxID=53437 RepID=A0ABV5E2J6_9ACTN|nr:MULTISPECIES: septal ring lytic transglycosylase RlpA family protein [Nocardiopsis]MEC3891395.1 septal ring lytic transglycosylase RlpA family protein [Nocardiopsis sp. LDBS1602]
MGKHEPQNPPVDDPMDDLAAATGPAETPLGPRRAAKRSRRKRAMIVASAAGLTLVVGGGAATAVIVSGADPGDATSTVTIPQAQPDPLVAAEGDTERDPELLERAEQARAQATTSQSASGPAIREEPDPEPETQSTESTDTGGSDTSASSGGGQGTGEGGTCQASFYGDGFHGATTANGETFDTYGMTAAHKTLPFDTMVRVTNPSNGKSVTVRINDRGPYISGRCLDLSTAAFDEIIGTGAGVGTVDWEVVG